MQRKKTDSVCLYESPFIYIVRFIPAYTVKWVV